MGCCNSTPRASTAPPINSRPATGRSSTGPRSLTIPVETTRTTAIGPGTTATFSAGNGTSRPNAPLRPSRPWHTAAHPNPQHPDQAWTPRSLRKERAAFFDTRVSGQPEVWAAVKLATELMREGQSEGNMADMSAAQGVLDAAGVTVPRGRLEDGAWDERGVLYKCPAWVVSDPVDLARAGEDDDDDEDEDDDAVVGEGTKEEVVDEDDDVESKKLDKGKGKLAESPNAIKVRARLSDRGTDIVVVIDKGQPVKTLAKRVIEQGNIPSGTRVKISYLGRILRDNQPLLEQGWQSGHVVNAFVFQ